MFLYYCGSVGVCIHYKTSVYVYNLPCYKIGFILHQEQRGHGNILRGPEPSYWQRFGNFFSFGIIPVVHHLSDDGMGGNGIHIYPERAELSGQ